MCISSDGYVRLKTDTFVLYAYYSLIGAAFVESSLNRYRRYWNLEDVHDQIINSQTLLRITKAKFEFPARNKKKT